MAYLFSDRKIVSISDLLKRLSYDSQKIKGPIWFRGQSHIEWELKPSIFVNPKKSEMEYLKEFKQSAMLLVEPRPKESYEWLFIMRHNHIPTRLLDWTESPLTALYFAVNDEEDKKFEHDAIIWSLLPFELNNYTTHLKGKKTLPSFEEDAFLESYTTNQFDISSPENANPTIAIIAPRNSKRMQAQLSVFTISHHDRTSIDKLGNSKHIWRYIIPKHAKKNIKKELEMLKIDSFQLFPELPYIYEKIKGVS